MFHLYPIHTKNYTMDEKPVLHKNTSGCDIYNGEMQCGGELIPVSYISIPKSKWNKWQKRSTLVTHIYPYTLPSYGVLEARRGHSAGESGAVEDEEKIFLVTERITDTLYGYFRRSPAYENGFLQAEKSTVLKEMVRSIQYLLENHIEPEFDGRFTIFILNGRAVFAHLDRITDTSNWDSNLLNKIQPRLNKMLRSLLHYGVNSNSDIYPEVGIASRAELEDFINLTISQRCSSSFINEQHPFTLTVEERRTFAKIAMMAHKSNVPKLLRKLTYNLSSAQFASTDDWRVLGCQCPLLRDTIISMEKTSGREGESNWLGEFIDGSIYGQFVLMRNFCVRYPDDQERAISEDCYFDKSNLHRQLMAYVGEFCYLQIFYGVTWT